MTPIAFLIFNRPDTTLKVFEAIREAKPPLLMVVADGPRQDKPGEAEKCAATRKIIAQVDWQCEVRTLYSDVNLGCKRRVASGLSWVFTQVEEAIILEDDCLPHPTFFRFCEELLDYYRDDKRIMVISGDNYQFGRQRTEYSYYFSRYNHCWGWATWRRAWKYYDMEMKLWPKIRDEGGLRCILEDSKAIKYWSNILQKTYAGEIDTWDFQWTFACWVQSGLTILPDVNLVSNIGFGPEATHTKDSGNHSANLPVQAMGFPLQHPPLVIRQTEADAFTQRNHFDNHNIMRRIVRKTKKLFKI
ncbi:MAG: glycosyltransferase family 2 protein [Gomphosphaeria aponina SAG 52.96 = DSM 107014]|uniref:Glycosyltransferase family 2 protein n=1 Tax=Gomphosphaeria aponina SAG 52.96 = DSM 107014 TaxID=1521640 RepID=A0A941GP36_9CHRO|nr:glycosyltransferase family 2 protein [Gomphosphaeria aponina SAG 52.96 = DSM 107014]